MELVTVAIAARNAGDFISDALSSIEASAGGLFNHETLVADGGSQDDTIALARKFANTRIVSVSDTGIYDGMNRAIAAATGKYILILNADDLLLPGALGGALRTLESEASYDFVSGGVLFGRSLNDAMLRHHDTALSREGALFGIPVINARLFRASLLQRVGPLLTNAGLAADRDLLLRIVGSGAVGTTIDAPLYFYRSHSGSHTISGDRSGRSRVYEAETELAAYYLRQPNTSAEVRVLARAAYSVAVMKRRLAAKREAWPSPREASQTNLLDLARGTCLALRWRGRLSGA